MSYFPQLPSLLPRCRCARGQGSSFLVSAGSVGKEFRSAPAELWVLRPAPLPRAGDGGRRAVVGGGSQSVVGRNRGCALGSSCQHKRRTRVSRGADFTEPAWREGPRPWCRGGLEGWARREVPHLVRHARFHCVLLFLCLQEKAENVKMFLPSSRAGFAIGSCRRRRTGCSSALPLVPRLTQL